MPETPIPVTHDESARRFTLSLGGETAVLTYQRQPGTMTFLLTEVPPALEGQGIAGRLATAGLEFARAQGLTVIPLCPYVAGFIRKHQEYRDLVHHDHRDRLAGGS